MRFLTVLVLATVAMGWAGAQDARKGDVYPLGDCVVSGEALDAKGAPVVRVYDGREFRFCCEGCVPQFEANRAEFTKKADAEIIKAQLPFYPMAKCVDMPEDDIDAKYDYVLNNRLVRVCCKDCIKEINAEPEKYLPKLDQAVIEKQKPNYPLDTCLVSGDKLDGSHGEPVEYVTGNRLVRLCCRDCIKEFEKSPDKFFGKLDEAEKNRPAAK